jgi:two-component system LytT family sensor kinase
MLRWWLVSVVVWTTLALLAVTQGYFSALQRGLGEQGEFGWWRLLGQWLPRYEVWAVLSPPIFWLATRFLIERVRLPGRIALHVALSAGIAMLAAGLHSAVICALWPHPSWWLHFQKMLLANFTDGVVTYWTILCVAHALAYRAQARDRELAAARLDTRLKAAELATLRLQLNPHFLFNALNTLGVLMREDQAAADRLLERLSGFLRAVLAGQGSEEVTLTEELAILGHYLAVEQERFGDRLRVELEVAPDLSGALVPRMILQPLVENALKHGILDRKRGGRVTIGAARTGDDLVLTVTDDGRGWGGAAPNGRRGVGLTNTTLRLEKLYSGRSRLELAEASTGGAIARLVLPYVRKTSTSHA